MMESFSLEFPIKPSILIESWSGVWSRARHRKQLANHQKCQIWIEIKQEWKNNTEPICYGDSSIEFIILYFFFLVPTRRSHGARIYEFLLNKNDIMPSSWPRAAINHMENSWARSSDRQHPTKTLKQRTRSMAPTLSHVCRVCVCERDSLVKVALTHTNSRTHATQPVNEQLTNSQWVPGNTRGRKSSLYNKKKTHRLKQLRNADDERMRKYH